MKIALAQLNYHIANFKANSKKIIAHIDKAKDKNADLVIFSELGLCGYPPQDLLEQEDFIGETEKHIEIIAKASAGIAVIIGAPVINKSKQGKKLFNAALFIDNGKVAHIQAKTHLPTYDVFDEYRYFEHNTTFDIIEFKGKRIALTICEDLWDTQPVGNSFAKDKLYTVSPMEKYSAQNPDFVINIAASPFSYNQDDNRRNILVNNAVEYAIPIIYVNQVGAQTELIFDGGSMVLNKKGKVVKNLKHFEEDFLLIDVDEIDKLTEINQAPYERIAKIYDALVLGIRDYFSKMNFRTATLGLSGGIDSAVTLAIAAEALGSENLQVLLLPSKYSSDHSIKDAIDLAHNLGVKYEIISIEKIVSAFDGSLGKLFENLQPDIAEENIQARARGVLLMALSNKFGNILLNTSNKSEAAVGYSTLYGDMNGGLSVLGDVYKTDIFKLARYINRDSEIIPENTITKPPSAELRPDQKDSDSLPDYDTLDTILFNYIELKKSSADIASLGFDLDLVMKVISMVNRNEYKRFQSPPILRVSSKAFGFGRRMPLVAKY
ncbi:MAG: NAD+ synthase [Bacteroidales bacterium]|nr:NAD+ synthase [Bacteroidales bacterium]MCF8455431.1 NAD+ synthase [Bacteroidales bacterium]